jgi:glucose/mannose-6-phosphate isomerase
MNPNTNDEFNEEYDRQGMLSTLEMAPEHCREALQKTEKINLKINSKTINNIVIAGMGGSAIGGILLNDWLIQESKIPIIISQNYNLPRFVDDNTLVIAVSYSGNTEETISALNDALERKSQVITITSGGQLERLSLDGDIPCVKLPPGMQPRAALHYQFICLAVIARKLSLFNNTGEDIDEAIEILEKMRDELTIDPSDRNIAKMLARELKDYIPFVYGSHLLKGVAYRYSTQFNENSKTPAYAGHFPEAFHNAVMISEASSDILEKIRVLFLRDSIENNRKKIDGFKELLESRNVGIYEVKARGEGKLARILSTLYLGDYVSTYLGLLYQVDPSSVNSIIAIKQI